MYAQRARNREDREIENRERDAFVRKKESRQRRLFILEETIMQLIR